MKKTLSLMTLGILLVALILLLTGCTTTMSYTYQVTTGDSIKIELNTTGGYNISSTVPFEIKKDDKILTQGTFITLDGYDYYISVVNSTSTSKIIEQGTKNGVEYTFYSYNGVEFNYIIKIIGSNTGILLANAESQESAKDCFERMTFSKQ